MKTIIIAVLAFMTITCSAQNNFKSANVHRTSAMRTSSNSINFNSNTIYTTYHAWTAVSVKLEEGCTKVTKICYPNTTGTWIQSTGTEFIEDCDTGTRYYLRDSSIGISPERTILHSKQPYTFTETYIALPEYVSRINICSGATYYVKELQIR